MNRLASTAYSTISFQAAAGDAILEDKESTARRTERYSSFTARAGRQAGRQAPGADDDMLVGVPDNLACATADHKMMLDRPSRRLNPALPSPSGCRVFM